MRNKENPPSVAAQSQLMVLRHIPLISPRPSTSSHATSRRAANEQRSKLNNWKENTYNSKLSIKKSFDIADAQNTAPRSILRKYLKLL